MEERRKAKTLGRSSYENQRRTSITPLQPTAEKRGD